MSNEAIQFKKNNQHLDYKSMSLSELNALPKYFGIVNFKITNTNFFILNVLNDDSSAVKFFWQDSHDLPSLDLWYDLCKDEGLYLDIGAHTGLYTFTTLKANKNNQVIAIEPFYLNLARLQVNARLNGLENNIDCKLLALSNKEEDKFFKIDTPTSYLSKGGKIAKEGEKIQVLKIDSFLDRFEKKKLKAIKIDTEGEDFHVLAGGTIAIQKYKPSIIIEVRDSNKFQIQEFLSDLNYSLFNIKDLDTPINLKNFNIDGVENIYAKNNEII